MKKKYSLALGGGAAKGIAHIGVIKYLQVNNIEVNEVSGTSMGALVAALFATGKTWEEISEIAKTVSYVKLVDVNLKEGLLKGNKVHKYLEKLFGNAKIEDLPIKLKIVATCLENGEKKVFGKGKVADAVRASVSLPGVFEPFGIGAKNYIDGGIVNNLPIEVLEGKHIIAVSVLKKVNHDLKRERKVFGLNFNLWFFSLNFQILQRTVIFMIKQNEDRSIHDYRKKITLIDPDFGVLDFYSFNEVDKLVNIGFNKAGKVMEATK